MNDKPAVQMVERTESQSLVLARISRTMVHLYKEQFGRGPTKARTNFAGPDTVVCTLEDSFTPAERRLVEMDEHQRLRDTRLFFQHATADQFCAAIEAILGRQVRAFVSGTDTWHDISTEVFYLKPVHAPSSSDSFAAGFDVAPSGQEQVTTDGESRRHESDE